MNSGRLFSLYGRLPEVSNVFFCNNNRLRPSVFAVFVTEKIDSLIAVKKFQEFIIVKSFQCLIALHADKSHFR